MCRLRVAIKTFNFFCAWAKNKNTKQRLVGEKGVKLGQKVVLKSLIKSSQFEVARSQNRVAGNSIIYETITIT